MKSTLLLALAFLCAVPAFAQIGAPVPGGFPPENLPPSTARLALNDSDGFVMPDYREEYGVRTEADGSVVLAKRVREITFANETYNPRRGEFNPGSSYPLGYTVTARGAELVFRWTRPHATFPEVNYANFTVIANRLKLPWVALWDETVGHTARAQGTRFLSPEEWIVLNSLPRDCAAFAFAALELQNPDVATGRARAYRWLGRVGSSPDLKNLADNLRRSLLEAAVDDSEREAMRSLDTELLHKWALEEYKDILSIYSGVLGRRGIVRGGSAQP